MWCTSEKKGIEKLQLKDLHYIPHNLIGDTTGSALKMINPMTFMWRTLLRYSQNNERFLNWTDVWILNDSFQFKRVMPDFCGYNRELNIERGSCDYVTSQNIPLRYPFEVSSNVLAQDKAQLPLSITYCNGVEHSSPVNRRCGFEFAWR